ncbi:hypothetical protein, partial [Pseudomonas aeruginosa]|uniref:hypothetical protein n=1 Tax=Pseudomonas aeruginosa TaxID=287 RepID=UPI003CEFF5E3
SEKVGLKLNIQKTKIMASSTITSWQIDGETMETVTNFNSGGAPKSLQASHIAAAAKLLQLCPTLCGCPLGSPVPGILQARTLEWVAISFSNA